MNYKVAILIPCHNEEKTITKVVMDYFQIFSNTDYDFSIHICDNNSTDNTANLIKKMESDRVFLYNEPRIGKGFAVRKMLNSIIADCYILVDGDDTYPSFDSLKMVEIIKNKQADMVVGDRLSSNYKFQNTRLFHNFGNHLVCNLVNFLFKSKIKDIMSGYRVMSHDFVKTLPLLTSGFEIETEITILALDSKAAITEIPIKYKNRPVGSSSKLNTFVDGFKILKTIFILFKDFKPFEFFSFCSFLTFLLFLYLFIPVFLEFIETSEVARFPTLFISCFVELCSVLLFFTGIILSVVIKMFKRTKEIELRKNICG